MPPPPVVLRAFDQIDYPAGSGEDAFEDVPTQSLPGRTSRRLDFVSLLNRRDHVSYPPEPDRILSSSYVSMTTSVLATPLMYLIL